MFSTLVRRTHMYLALFLFPWMVMYAASTLAMNHRAALAASTPVGFETERVLTYDGIFPPDANPKQIATQLLASLDLDGAHAVVRRDDGTIVVTRNDLITPRRLTFTPADRRLTIERMPRRASAFLERFHRRRGYATGYAVDTLWAVSVDLVIAAMALWVLSGLWMWWEMSATRLAGASALAGGAGLFALYLLTL